MNLEHRIVTVRDNPQAVARAHALAQSLCEQIVQQKPELGKYALAHPDESYITIAKKFKIEDIYSQSVLKKGVGLALDRLLTSQERKKLTQSRRLYSARILNTTYSDKAAKGQKKGGQVAMNKLTSEDRKLRIIKQGLTPWEHKELEYLQNCALKPKYHWSSGPQKGRPSYELIANALNDEFHAGKQVRNAKTTRSKYSALIYA
jgi:hypothetical protein